MSAVLQKAKQDLEIMIITGNGQIGMTADRGVVFEKFHDDIGNVIDLIEIHLQSPYTAGLPIQNVV